MILLLSVLALCVAVRASDVAYLARDFFAVRNVDVVVISVSNAKGEAAGHLIEWTIMAMDKIRKQLSKRTQECVLNKHARECILDLI